MSCRKGAYVLLFLTAVAVMLIAPVSSDADATVDKIEV